MSVWSVDADDIKTEQDFEEVLLYKTPWIDNFLDMERGSKFIVIATKGFGKTFLLKAKRIMFQKERKDIQCIPENSLLDKPAGETIFSAEMCDFYSGTSNHWVTIWTASIVITVLKQLGKLSDDDLSKKLSVLKNNNLKTVTDHLVNILKMGRENYFELVDNYNENLIPKSKNIHSPIAIFIDNVDEYFKKHINPEIMRPSDVGEVSPTIWYYSQIGLIEAIYQLQRSNHHLKVFASIRKEAVLKLKEFDPMIQQYLGSSVDVVYSRQDIMEIFIKNIKKDKNLIDASIKENNPIQAFLGLLQVTHSLSREKENIFDYIYRHTLQRPRDFMVIGARISDTRPLDRTEDNLKIIINKAASDIATQYINETLPHIDGLDYDKLFELIDKNILTKKDVNKICSKYNSNSCYDSDCKLCDLNHVFCNLYKAGLLGYIRKDLVYASKIQKFALPGEYTFDPNGILPTSPYYFLHPILEEKIRSLNPKFEKNIAKIIIGYDHPWNGLKQTTPSILPDQLRDGTTKKIVLVACHPDDEVLSSGALLLKAARQGFQIFLVLVTQGESSGSLNAKNRKDEANEIALKLNATITFLNYSNNDLLCDGKIDLSETTKEVEKLIKDISPDIIVWPHGESPDQHQDHVTLHKAITNIQKRYKSDQCCWIAAQPPVFGDSGFKPTNYLKIDAELLKQKYRLMRLYKSEKLKKFASYQFIKTKALHWASEGNCSFDYAEPFQLHKGFLPLELFV
ncbi:MAG: PIG-L family deacetylase [Pedobacter sp.]